MDIIQGAVTGVIQGLTEFLPVSSSGHLVLTSCLYKLFTGQEIASGGNEEIFFDIMLHLGTLVAVFIFFREDLKKLFGAFWEALKKRDFKDNQEAQIPLYIMVGTIVTAIVALPFKDFFESLVSNPSLVGLILIITGTLLYSTEYISAKLGKKLKKMTLNKSIIIGIAQGLAVAPGLSRSGSTIAAGLATGLDRVTAARYSFLLSIPIIILAALFHIVDISSFSEIASYSWKAIIIGTILSAVVGYLCIKYFIQFLNNHKLNIFAYYCWAVGAAMFFFFRG